MLLRIVSQIPAAWQTTVAWRAQPSSSTQFINRRFHDYSSPPPQGAHGQEWQVSVHPEDLAQVVKYWTEVVSSGEPGEMEVWMR
jgi:hypothetical protein